jgi:hypothetical protein
MLKKRIALAVTALSFLTLPTASQALPLSPLPEMEVMTKLADWLDRLPGALRGTPARAARARPRPARAGRNRVKNGCAIDPNGQPLCDPVTKPGAGATASSTDGGSDG